MKREWWHSLTVYQIYTRSFCDSNGDGIGDFGGILQKLDYLQELGVGAIWLSPFNDSPNYDNGYDVSGYYKVMEEAGTMEELEELIAACEKREIVVMMDLVLNHSSHLHPWFLEARKDRNSKYHDFYIWKEGTKEQPPEGGGAFFGGSTWEWVPEVQEYYYHSFSVMQPDLNWKNPSLRKELYRMIQFWMDKGIRGFRLDAIDNIVKDGHGGNDTHSEQIHTYLMEMNQNTYGKSEQILTVGETGGATVEMAQQYSDPESQELSMIFQFELMGIDGIRSGNWDPKPYTLPQLKQIFEKWQTGLEEKENICSQIQEKYKGIRYISKTERISILLLAGYLSVKDTAFQIWNDLKEDAPRAVGWCSGAWTADCLYEKAEKLRNCCVLAFHMDPPELFCADEKETEEEKAYHFREQKERREEICRLVSNGKKQETLQTMKDYFQKLKGLAPKTFAGEVYNLYMYLWNRLVLSDELLENWMEAEKILRENEIFEANNSYQMREKMKQYLERMLAFFEEQNQNPNYYAVYQVKTYLQEHCSESADIEKLAAEVGLSPNYLRSLFKEATGKTILEYNTEMRLQRAAELLKNKKNKVREVSLAVGYENVSYFGVVFQKRFGVTPNEYRKMV